jgi:hypothetical protein
MRYQPPGLMRIAAPIDPHIANGKILKLASAGTHHVDTSGRQRDIAVHLHDNRVGRAGHCTADCCARLTFDT